MKNIHILPTDKPSRLYEFGGQYHLQPKAQENFRSYHIYITNDEEIKEGDWVIFDELEIVKCTYSKNGEFLFSKPLISSSNHHFSYFKKIILTTDTTLIEDGVQPVTNTFAEWFVKNPSCEYVEVESNRCLVKRGNCDCSERDIDCQCLGYKIIIPQEEPKCTCKEHDPYCCQVHGICLTCVKKEEPKQETLEDAFEKTWLKSVFTKYSEPKIVGKELFIKGAKWQAERMYSEEDMIRFGAFMQQRHTGVKESFEQFKKK